MSDFQHKPDSGSIFKNDKREKDSHPHGKGSALIGGVEYWVSSWNNVSQKDGQPYRSLKFTRKDAAHNQGMTQAKQAAQPTDFGDLEDDIAF